MKDKKWIPFCSYSKDYYSYIVFAKMRQNGIIKFKTKRICMEIRSYPKIDINEQFKEVLNERD